MHPWIAVSDVDLVSIPPRLADGDVHRLERHRLAGDKPVLVSMRGLVEATAYGILGLRLRLDALVAAGRAVSILMPYDPDIGARLSSAGFFNELRLSLEGDRGGHPTSPWNGVAISRLATESDLFTFAEGVAAKFSDPAVASIVQLAAFVAGDRARSAWGPRGRR